MRLTAIIQFLEFQKGVHGLSSRSHARDLLFSKGPLLSHLIFTQCQPAFFEQQSNLIRGG